MHYLKKRRSSKKKKKLMRRILMELVEITCLLRKIHRDMPRKYSGDLGPM